MYTIYGLKWCIFCLRAINFMQEKGLEFHYYPMDNSPIRLTSLKDMYKHKTVPLVVWLSGREECWCTSQRLSTGQSTSGSKIC